MIQHPSFGWSPSALSPPDYFEPIRSQAHNRWNQLENDPELAGPWRQLFMQVQSPRHVLSELLQNADDAGAQHVSVRLEENRFAFQHDGKDFTADDFASLCKFGFSNKRNLHTVGFRGIGFKSTFSLGDEVHVTTPTLSVVFHKTRFTEPVWGNGDRHRATTVRVRVQDHNRRVELQKNLREWLESPASLLFFQNIQTLDICGSVIRRQPIGPGPIANSEWLELQGESTRKVLVIRSALAAFPDDAVTEIKQERNANNLELPACRVEIVLGLSDPQRLFVVLPTGVMPSLPFSCNAPFLQDPARLGIKPSATSPTNRWLLDRIGELCVSSLSKWLGNRDLSIAERARAYSLIPTRRLYGDSLQEDVTERVVNHFAAAVAGSRILLTADGEVTRPPCCIGCPSELHAVWQPNELAAIFGKEGHAVLSPEVNDNYRMVLAHWKWLHVLTMDDVVRSLSNDAPPPTPRSWEGLSQLWKALHAKMVHRLAKDQAQQLQIVPAQGRHVLKRAADVVRLGGKRTLPNADDWSFLAGGLDVLDPSWIDYLTPVTKEEEDSPADGCTSCSTVDERTDASATARELLAIFGLNLPTPADRMLERAARVRSTRAGQSRSDAVRFAHIVAALDSKVPPGFRYWVRNNRATNVTAGIVLNQGAVAENLLPANWADAHLLHEDYFKESPSCDQRQWFAWATSDKSGLLAFAPMQQVTKEIETRDGLAQFLRTRNAIAPETFRYRAGTFRIVDYDFPAEVVNYLEVLAATDEETWCRVLSLIMNSPAAYWTGSLEAKVKEVATNGHAYPAQCDKFASTWVARLANRKSLPDVYGRAHVPTGLMMRTPETEAWMNLKPFVRAEFDTTVTQPLLKLLDVQDSPLDPTTLINRIRALAAVAPPRLDEVIKWFEALDKVAARCPKPELMDLRDTFAREQLILTAQGDWARSDEVYLYADEETLPDAPVVHPSIADLLLWKQLGVADRPTVELVLQWLSGLESERTLDSSTLRRVRGCIQVYPSEVWSECGHWLALDNSWRPVSELAFFLGNASGMRVADLFPAVRARTADLRNLAPGAQRNSIGHGLRDLAAEIESRLTNIAACSAPATPKPWMRALGSGLQRVKQTDDDANKTVHSLGKRLERTMWQTVDSITVTPYLDGTPAGQPLPRTALWHETTLLALNRPIVQQFKALVDELARPFSWAAITEAIKACIDRDPEFIEEYLGCYFEIEEDGPACESQENTVLMESAVTDEVTKDDRENDAHVGGLTPRSPAEGENESAPSLARGPAAEAETTTPADSDLQRETASDVNQLENGEDGELDAAVAILGETNRLIRSGQEARGDASEGPSRGTSDCDQTSPTGSNSDGSTAPRDSKRSGNGGPPPHRPRRPNDESNQSAGHTQAALIESYARLNGFERTEDGGVFRHADGRCLQHCCGMLDYELTSREGQALRSLWVKPQTLLEGVQIPADVWELITLAPEHHAAVVLGSQGNPKELLGTELIDLTERGILQLFPATYRLKQVAENVTESV